MSPQARVGLVSLLAFILAVATVVFLRGGGLFHRPEYELAVSFTDVTGVDLGTPVRVSGVVVGRVRGISLAPNYQGRLKLGIDEGVQIPQGSRFFIATAGIVGDRSIEIAPGPPTATPIPPGAELQGAEPVSIERLATRFQEVATRVETLVDNINGLVTDPEMRANLREALRNANEATLIARRAALTVEETTRQVQTLINTDARQIVHDLRQMAHNLVETSSQVQSFIETTSGDGALARDIKATASSLRDASERIARMAADLQGLINQENVGKAREIVNEARETVRDVRTIVQRANTVLERVDRLIPSDLRLPSLRSLIRLDYEVWYSGQRAGHDLDLSVLPDSDRFYRLGLHNIGATNGIVLQVGERLTPTLAARAGIFESQVGVGLDYRLLDPLSVSLDLYNLNQFTLDATGRYQVAPNWRITLGGKDLLRQPAFLFGIGANY